MRQMRTLWARVLGMFGREARDAGLREELLAHLDLHTAENIRRGMSPEAARRDAILASGGLVQAEESVRERRALPWVESVTADLRYAIRALRHNPSFAAIAMITLALGIGANAALFSVVNAVVLKPLAYPESERLMSLESVRNGASMSVSPADFMDWRRQAQSFSGLAAGYPAQTILTGSGEPERFSVGLVTDNTFAVLALRPVHGRGFAPGEDDEAAPRVAMLSEGLWRRRFGGDTAVVGRALTFDGFPTTIIGIAPDALRWPGRADVWMTTRFEARHLTDAARGARWLSVVGRLRPDASVAAASLEMEGVAARLATHDPRHNEGVGSRVTPLLASMIGDIHRPLFVLLGAVGFVLLIACANVASLTLGRIAARDAELALRTALGAARTRIARQILTESLLLAIAGGVLGLGLALVGLKLLTAVAPADLPRLNEVRLDGSVLAFTFGLTLLTGILFGVVPALQGTSKDLHVRLRSAGRGTEGRRATARSRRTLVVVEMALAIVLLAGAGLLLRSFARLASVDPGFRADRVATFNVSLPSTKYGEPEQRRVFISELLDGIGRAPQVTDAAVSFALPLDGDSFGFTFEIRGRELPAGAEEPRAQARVASEGYFRAMGIPLLSGRLFDARDRYGAEQALVISAEVARRYFPGEDPMGKYLETGWGMDERRFGGQVIGIVGDVRQYSLDGDKTPHIYMVHDQWPLSDYEVVVRSTAPVATTLRAARTVLRALDPEIPMNDARPLQEIVDASLGPRRFYLTLLGTFAAVAVVLALVGIYGVIAYGVRLRQKEIGVRLALGASRGRVLRMVLSDGLRVAIAGVAIGVAAALGLTSLLDSLLFGVGSRDPLTFVAVPVALMVAALIACVMPALRAAGLDPVQTIRAE